MSDALALAPGASAPGVPPRGAGLARKLARSRRRRQLGAAALIAPLLLFLAAAFFAPLVSVLFYAVEADDVSRILPRSAEAIRGWDGDGLPDETVFAALAEDLVEAAEARTAARAATALNHHLSGFRSLLMGAARRAETLQAPHAETFAALDPRWAETGTWTAFQRGAARFTDRYLLAAVDRERDAEGRIVLAPEQRRIYIDYLERTLWISLVVTVACLLIAYPMAWLIANASDANRRILFILVLLPFWTSLLVRTAAWVILLQRNGAVNAGLMWMGITDEPMQLIFNRFGVYVAMTHVLLPFMILPLYSAMRGIPRDHMRASASLGARPFATFLQVYLPQTLPGVGAGCLLVWVLAIGFYITPALVGGGGDQMISFLIAEFTLRTANWHMAAALSLLLLVMVAVVVPVMMRLTGASRLDPGR